MHPLVFVAHEGSRGSLLCIPNNWITGDDPASKRLPAFLREVILRTGLLTLTGHRSSVLMTETRFCERLQIYSASIVMGLVGFLQQRSIEDRREYG
jgi:hypothetical protein